MWRVDKLSCNQSTLIIEVGGKETNIRCLLVLFRMTTQAFAGVQLRDANTIVVDATLVRLQGVDAPELEYSSGQDARHCMVNDLRGKQVICSLPGERIHGRYIGVC